MKTARVEDPECMQTTFEIALHNGCQIRETRIPLNSMEFTEEKITIPLPKEREDRVFSIPTALQPLLEEIAKAKQKFTVEFPFQPSRRW